MKTLFAVLFLTLAACSSNPKVATEPVASSAPPIIATPIPPEEKTDHPPSRVISGKAVLKAEKSEKPVYLSRLPLGLYKKSGDKWTFVSEFSTETDGSFSISQNLEPGAYEIRVESPKFTGKLPLNLDKSLDNLIFEVKRAY